MAYTCALPDLHDAAYFNTILGKNTDFAAENFWTLRGIFAAAALKICFVLLKKASRLFIYTVTFHFLVSSDLW